jgi:hypothetical protein
MSRGKLELLHEELDRELLEVEAPYAPLASKSKEPRESLKPRASSQLE